MAYKNANYFYSLALNYYGFKTWEDLDILARRRKWSAKTYLGKRKEIEKLQTFLHGQYILGATDAINEIKNN